jgi:lipopolysaccharide biosynthesis protein
MKDSFPRLIAFYLPQYHPIPENDAWWGKGFTEWTNVAKAKPLFKSHYQPHIPADLGFYDLRVPETRQAQADMARQYGIYGFCYYHYWFNGKRLLERPFQEVLESGEPDFPFCLCWANENWTRRWDGQDQDILMYQYNSDTDDQNHIDSLISVFKDPRYIKIDGRPMVLIYRANNLKQPEKTADIWRNAVKKAGFPDLYLCMVISLSILHFDPEKIGFDGAVDFVPDWKYLPPSKKPIGFNHSFFRRLIRRFSRSTYLRNHIRSYPDLAESMLNRPKPEYKVFPGVTPGWDNSPRKQDNAIIFLNSKPDTYQHWLEEAIKQCETSFSNPNERFVFINAWNEWGEGNHLEPDLRYGRAYLEATRNALKTTK